MIWWCADADPPTGRQVPAFVGMTREDRTVKDDRKRKKRGGIKI